MASKTKQLQEAFGNIEKINPDSEAYQKFCEFLDARTDDELKDFYQAKIKFLSSLSLTRLIRRGVKL